MSNHWWSANSQTHWKTSKPTSHCNGYYCFCNNFVIFKVSLECRNFLSLKSSLHAKLEQSNHHRHAESHLFSYFCIVVEVTLEKDSLECKWRKRYKEYVAVSCMQILDATSANYLQSLLQGSWGQKCFNQKMKTYPKHLRFYAT